MITRLCPQEKYGRGCDYAIIDEDKRLANLFEIKSCTLALHDASKAVQQFQDTRDDLVRAESKYNSYEFRFTVVHKKATSCKVISQASAILELKKVNLGNWRNNPFDEILRDFERDCPDST